MIAALTHPAMLFWLCLCALFVFLSGMYSGSETGLYCINRLRLQLAAHEKNRPAARLVRLLDDQPGLLFTTLLGTNVANYLAPVCLTVIFLSGITSVSGSEREHLAELYTTSILTPVVFIFGEIVPKNLFQRHADRFMIQVSSFIAATYHTFRLMGITALQRKISNFVMRRLHRSPETGSALHSRISMYQMLREGAAAGALSRTQIFMLERIHNLQRIRVGPVMVPGSKTAILSADATRVEVDRFIRATRYSRMLVYRGSRSRIVGVVHLLDLLTAEPDTPMSRLMSPPVELTPEIPVIDALSVLQRKHRRMAIVVDKWGNCVGIVTVKDLVEEIVGELAAW